MSDDDCAQRMMIAHAVLRACAVDDDHHDDHVHIMSDFDDDTMMMMMMMMMIMMMMMMMMMMIVKVSVAFFIPEIKVIFFSYAKSSSRCHQTFQTQEKNDKNVSIETDPQSKHTQTNTKMQQKKKF